VSKSPASSCAESDLSEIEQACMIYTGELLESIYSEPIVEHRNCMSEMYMMALKYLADAFLSRRNYEKSLHYLKKILSIDPLRENVHRDIMMVYYHQGLRAHAHAQYETCRSLLARELGVAPARETKILHDKILAEETSFELNPEIAGLESGSQMIEKYIEMKNKIRHLGQALAQAEEVCNSIMRDLGLADSEHIPFL
jgi:DNA-binding SARP family transcriptional activator